MTCLLDDNKGRQHLFCSSLLQDRLLLASLHELHLHEATAEGWLLAYLLLSLSFCHRPVSCDTATLSQQKLCHTGRVCFDLHRSEQGVAASAAQMCVMQAVEVTQSWILLHTSRLPLQLLLLQLASV